MSSDEDYGYDDDVDEEPRTDCDCEDEDDEEHAVEDDDCDREDDDDDDDDADQTYQSDPEVEVDNFTALTMEELEKRQNHDVCTICSVLSVSREVAISILLHFNWNVTTAQDQWFADEQAIRKAIGSLSAGTTIVPKSCIQNNTTSMLCGICLEDMEVNQMRAAVCGHRFCTVCWNSYISIAINDGSGCLNLRCPDPCCCCVVIGEDMLKLVSIESQNKYKNYLLRSYVENSKKLKWCPAPDCNNAIEYVLGSDNFDVECNCLFKFCWNCLEEIHRPVDCDTVAKWNLKKSTEGNNTEWILSNSKSCPKCKFPIQKNRGCMHMTCSCRHEFCWLCLNPWKDHGNSSLFSCNKYEKEKNTGNINGGDEVRKRSAKAKEYTDRYAHFYERWAANEESRKQSVVYLKEVENHGAKLQKLSQVQQVPITDIECIPKAWEQIIECRRVMKWAYAYGYYIEEAPKQKFFEFTQGEAEWSLERLHQCAEEDVMRYANAESPSPDFNIFKDKLTTLTQVTRGYFDNLVRALENGLVDVCTDSNPITLNKKKKKKRRASRL